MTADVGKKEKGQLPRVYFVLLGESTGQVTEKLQLVHMEETCHHYVAHVKVSLLFYPQTLISTDVHLELMETTFIVYYVCSDFQNYVSKVEEHSFFFFQSWSLAAPLFILLCWSQPLRGFVVGQDTSDTPWP